MTEPPGSTAQMNVPSTTSTLTTEPPGSTAQMNVPSTTSTLTTGPPGSTVQTNAEPGGSVVSVEVVDGAFV
jgi:hypothetical protein